VQQRLAKLTTSLTREIVEKFKTNKRYIHLLTTLLQMLSTWMKTNQTFFKSKSIIEDVIKLLLWISNYYETPLKTEKNITVSPISLLFVL